MSRLVPSFLLAALFLPYLAARAGELPTERPAAVGLSADKLTEIKPSLLKLVDEGKIAGGVALIARHGKVAYLEPFGVRNLADKSPMTVDTIFAIASMTKPITCVAAMMLVESGKLKLEDPIGKFIPDLNDLRVLGDAKDDTDDTIATVPSQRPITVRDLMTHTSGIAYGGFLSNNARLTRAYAKARVQDPGLESLSEQMTRLSKVPLAHQPGGGWTYGLSHDVLGRVVEVVSGETLETFFEEHLFKPLDMPDTGFLVPPEKRERMATIYRLAIDGKLTPLPTNHGSRKLFSGGGGLFSTARDYSRFTQMLLNRGQLDGVRILKEETIATMTVNQIGTHNALLLYKYGLGFGIERGLQPVAGKTTPGRYFWGGVFSTYFWIDPNRDLFGVILTQLLPTNSSGVERTFRRLVEEATEN